jgi:hypothetical protein
MSDAPRLRETTFNDPYGTWPVNGSVPTHKRRPVISIIWLLFGLFLTFWAVSSFIGMADEIFVGPALFLLVLGLACLVGMFFAYRAFWRGIR